MNSLTIQELQALLAVLPKSMRSRVFRDLLEAARPEQVEVVRAVA